MRAPRIRTECMQCGQDGKIGKKSNSTGHMPTQTPVALPSVRLQRKGNLSQESANAAQFSNLQGFAALSRLLIGFMMFRARMLDLSLDSDRGGLSLSLSLLSLSGGRLSLWQVRLSAHLCSIMISFTST